MFGGDGTKKKKPEIFKEGRKKRTEIKNSFEVEPVFFQLLKFTPSLGSDDMQEFHDKPKMR